MTAPTADQVASIEAAKAQLEYLSRQLDEAARHTYEALVPYLSIAPGSIEHEEQLHREWASALELMECALSVQAVLAPVSRYSDGLPPAPEWWSKESDPQEQRYAAAARLLFA